MVRNLVCLLLASPLLSQPVRPAPSQAPIDALIQSYASAYSQEHFAEAAANRHQARALLSQVPLNDPQFAHWARRVSELYDNGGLAVQARDVLEQALAAAKTLGDSSPVRVALLEALSRSWEQDRNLVKSVSYQEQAVAALAGGQDAALHQRLFRLYLQLGLVEDAATECPRVALSAQFRPQDAGAGDAMRRASEAVNAGRLDEGFTLTVQALDAAHNDSSFERAYAIASAQPPAKLDEIYRRVMALAGSWTALSVMPLLNAEQSYVIALQNHQRWSDSDVAIERYQATLTAARGAGTGWLDEVQRLRARQH